MGAPESGFKAAEQGTAETLLSAFRTIKPAERAKHANILDYWLSIRGDKDFPPLHDLDPLEISDAGPCSILLELISGGQDAEIRHLGDGLGEFCSSTRIIDAPNPSILHSIARKLPIQWFGNARADNLTDPAFVHRLKRAGCWMLALGIETESDDVRKDMVKRLERQKIETAFRNMRQAGVKSFAFFIFGYPGETPKTMAQTVEYAVALDPDFANFYPAVPYPGTALHEKCVREGLLGPKADDWSKMEYSYYLLQGHGLDERVVMDHINRAKRRFFLRPAYLARHAGDIVRLALTKQGIVWQVLVRTLFGARVTDATTRGGPAPSAGAAKAVAGSQ